MSKMDVSDTQLRVGLLTDARDKALTYEDYARSLKNYHAELVLNYEQAVFGRAETKQLQAIDQPLSIYAIVEDWCPDVIITLPIFARISEAVPGLHLYILPRPDHLDAAQSYLAEDGVSHVPTYIVVSNEERELGVFIERPAIIAGEFLRSAGAHKAKAMAQFSAQTLDEVPHSAIKDFVTTLLSERHAVRHIEQDAILEWFFHTAAGAGVH